MTIEQLLQNKSLKAKAKVVQIADWLMSGSLPTDELLSFAEKQKAPNKATCIEAIEYATKKNGSI